MKTLIINVPAKYLPEIEYTLRVVLKDALSLDYEIEEYNGEEIRIKVRGDTLKRSLIVENVLFNTPSEQWLKEESLPILPLSNWIISDDSLELKLCDKKLPIIYGRKLSNGKYFEQGKNYLHLGLDIFGSCFFMLTRYEEIVLKERDEHGRFPAKASLAYKEGFLLRPIVNEYIEVFWAAMKRLWPGLNRKQHNYKVLLTHDVDRPFLAYDRSWYKMILNIGADILRYKNFDLAVSRTRCKIQNNPKIDPANTFDFIMNLSEKYGLRSEFYFMTDHTAKSLDGSSYSLESPDIKALISEINKRGHTLGFHASYNSFCDSRRTKKEFEKLVAVAEELGIKQNSWGGRQHYLRWENPITWQNWEDAGLNYDGTLSFADHVGFRTGICYEYPVFNLLTRKSLQLREKPLIVMDGTLFGGDYMKLRPEDVLKYIEQLSLLCKRFGGTFTLLWHNSSLIEKWQKDIYRRILDVIV